MKWSQELAKERELILRFMESTGITIDDDNNLYVVDQYNHRILRLDINSGACYNSSWR